jgi:hypothetical protein
MLYIIDANDVNVASIVHNMLIDISLTLRTYLSGEIGRNWEKLGENWEKLARFDMSVERVCSQYDAAVAPTYSKLADFYIFGRTCYSSPSPIADDLREGKWSYNTCPNCQNARVKQTKQKKKEASDGANPYPKPSSAKRSIKGRLHRAPVAAAAANPCAAILLAFRFPCASLL